MVKTKFKPKKKKEKKTTKNNNYNKSAIEKARKELSSQKFHYKDKPVNGEPTDKQINAIKSFCRARELESNIIGITRKEASEILAYFFNKSGEEKKPKCWSKYITE